MPIADADADALADRIMPVMVAAFDPHWGEGWNRAQLVGSLAFRHTHAVLIDRLGRRAPDAGAPAGFALIRVAPGEEEVLLIAVRPEERGRGLGRKLLDRVIFDARGRNADRLFLEMRANNPAERLYRDIGFAPIGCRPEYYRLSDGSRIDAITFALRLSGRLHDPML